MTASIQSPAPQGRRYRFSLLRVLLCGVFLTVLVAVCMYLYHTAFDFYRARLLEEESKTLAWFAKQLSFSLPFIVICLFHYMVYHRHDRRDGVARREMFWEIVVLTLLVYCVLLPYLVRVSDAMYAASLEIGADIPKTDGKVEMTLAMKFHEWFVRLSVPLVGLAVFHGVRARREVRFPETETAEPVITKAEYDAQRAARTAEETAEETAVAAAETAAEATAETESPAASAKTVPSSDGADSASANSETEVVPHE